MSDLDITFPSTYIAMPRLKCQHCEDTFFLDLDRRRHEKGHMSVTDRIIIDKIEEQCNIQTIIYGVQKRCQLQKGHKGDHKFLPNNEIKKQDEKVLFEGGVTGTKIPRFELIPRAALIRLANRFELGIQRHGDKTWNVASPNQDALDNKEWLIARLAHVIDHATKAIEKLQGVGNYDTDAWYNSDDDAAAIMWGACVLIAAQERFKANMGEKEDDKSNSPTRP